MLDAADAMTVAVDAIKAVNLPEASDEALGLYYSLLWAEVKRVAQEVADRREAVRRAEDAALYASRYAYDMELRIIRGENV